MHIRMTICSTIDEEIKRRSDGGLGLLQLLKWLL